MFEIESRTRAQRACGEDASFSLRLLRAAVLAVALCGPSHATAQQASPPSPPTRDAAKAEWELAHIVEVAQQARDWVQRRRDQLGGLPDDVQPLVAKGQERLQQLRDAVRARDLPRARSQFRLVLEVFEEIRVRLNAAMDAQDAATTTPEQMAATLDRAVRGLRTHWSELKALAAQNPVATIDSELARIDGLIVALEKRPADAPPAALRQQVLDARGALQKVGTVITDRAEVQP